ncbi:MAG: PilC/PilY family type IV pilus protein [Holophagaceae bacterium]|nr:PilC/PilY family type IV pilus protein [Holophagaceae bacterium]
MRSKLGCLLTALLLLIPVGLSAQLDPRLRPADATDFLDLYQQSIQVKQKPEIMTIFDFSTSMWALMYHPLYQNLNATDGDASLASWVFEIPQTGTAKIDNITASSWSLSISGTSNSQITITFQNLVKPDGSIVTATDADACAGLNSYNGAIIVRPSSAGRYTGTFTSSSSTPRDVRHWLMAASHARYKVTAAQSAVSYALGRTIDLPIPWKIMGFNSTGNPLSSKTIKDLQIKKELNDKGEPVDVEYGSRLDLEYDLTYKYSSSATAVYSSSFGENATVASSSDRFYRVTFGSFYLKSPYIHWLFCGRWQSTTATPSTSGTNVNYMSNGNYYAPASSGIAGKFIVYDAGDSSALWAAGQTSGDWGRGYRGTSDNPAMNNKTTGPFVDIPKYDMNGKFLNMIKDYAFRYTIPPLTRIQANKLSAIQTWVKHQADVYWAYRFLSSGAGEANSGNATTIDNNSKKDLPTGNGLVTTKQLGGYPGWVVFNNTVSQGKNATNGNSVNAMQRLAATWATGSTPLAFAMSRSLAQYNDPNSVFNDVVGDAVSQCSNSFLILFTDGVANNANRGGETNVTPYVTGSGDNMAFNALTGNQEILKNKAGINNMGAWWNSFTFAGVGAHMANSSLGQGRENVDYMRVKNPGRKGSAQTSGTPETFLPYAIYGRNDVEFSTGTTGKPRRVTTMSVGVSLGGRYTAASGTKRNIFLTALLGDPESTSGRVIDFRAFDPPTFHPDGTVDQYNDWELDGSDPDAYPSKGKRKSGAVYYFDATDPDKLTTSLETAFTAAIAQGSNNAVSTPNLPFVGASLAGQVYMGSFNTPEGGGVLWTGDLLMFGVREEINSRGQMEIHMLNGRGERVTALDSDTAVWSASAALLDTNRPWRNRRLLTRLPNAPNDALTPFTDVGAPFTNLVNLKHIDPPAEVSSSPLVWKPAAERPLIDYPNPIDVVRYVMGADILSNDRDSDGRPRPNRSTIMGDVINSAPTAIEYTIDARKGGVHEAVMANIGRYSKFSSITNEDRQFRIILVGTNQGWLHCFGELSQKAKTPDGKEYTQAAVEELWAFMPTDFLPHLDYIMRSGNIHRFMADGTPNIYHLDVQTAEYPLGNGMVDQGERVIAVMGLGKGGRSYYAFNLADPFNPTIQWSMVPDEANALPSTRVVSGGPDIGSVRSMLGKWGYSTSTPAVGRIVHNNVLKDAVFLSGGLSVPRVEKLFQPSKDDPIPLMGRSVMALDVYTGEIIAAEDLSTRYGANVGPISAGVTPFEFIVNSGLAQRAYFMDYNGGLWAWGSVKVATAKPHEYYRIDTSELTDWGLRKVYQDSGLGSIYSVAPSPFRVANFTGEPKAGNIRPAAVGIAMVSGDRNNPMDYQYPEGGKPDNHKLTVVFDRQDIVAWKNPTYYPTYNSSTITNGDLMNFTTNSILDTTTPARCSGAFQYVQPGCTNYYLAPAVDNPSPFHGYFMNFPSRTGHFIAKGINRPMVVAGALFYTIFSPESADPCTGGIGKSEGWVVQDVLNPLKEDHRNESDTDPLILHSGRVSEFGGVASDYIQIGTRGVLQGGTPIGGGESGSLSLEASYADPSQGFPKPRVWRVVR